MPFADRPAGLRPGKASQLSPKRLSSTGDSMTEAIDSELPAANHWASWANGYHGFWEWLLGLTDVYSHNQRITKNFGSSGRANYMEAKSGSDMFDFPGQAAQSVSRKPSYVTVLMGHNDVCLEHLRRDPDRCGLRSQIQGGDGEAEEGICRREPPSMSWGSWTSTSSGRSPPTRGHWASWTAKSSGPRACSSGTPAQPC
ncbi:MAG: hypothetical protein MZV70_51425 [Desulfobacterales bacterium]|nr:hypothetical protein [Desulfobacterales bacterium]